MKKYITLGVIIVLVFAVISVIPSYISKRASIVQVTKLKTEMYSEYVLANGEIREESKSDIAFDYPIMVSKINFDIGDKVKKGDIIATIDKEQTISCIKSLSAMSQDSNLGEYSSVYAQGEISDEMISSQIGDNIVATADGTISNLDLAVGVSTIPKKTIASIISSDKIIAKIQIKEKDSSKVKLNQIVEISGSGFLGKSINGKLTKIYPVARKQFVGVNAETVVDAVVSLDSVNSDVKSGFNIKAKIITNTPKTINTIPYEAICQDDNNNQYVYTYKNGIKKNFVKLGAETQNGAEVLSGLTFSDVVILDAAKINSTKDIIKIKK